MCDRYQPLSALCSAQSLCWQSSRISRAADSLASMCTVAGSALFGFAFTSPVPPLSILLELLWVCAPENALAGEEERKEKERKVLELARPTPRPRSDFTRREGVMSCSFILFFLLLLLVLDSVLSFPPSCIHMALPHCGRPNMSGQESQRKKTYSKLAEETKTVAAL